MAGAPHIYLVAGEDSGDRLGASLMMALQETAHQQIHFSGVGGARMVTHGLHSLFPMTELSLMGLAEVLPHVPKILKRLRETADDIMAKKPDVVITIDSPGFTFRLAKMLRKRNCAAKLVHYVAPSVWAWRPGRAKTTAQLFDHLLCLLPFEPPYFEREGLRSTWVGHPAIYDHRSLMQLRKSGEGDRFRRQHEIGLDAPLLCVLPGSRRGELQRHLPIFVQTLRQLAKQHPRLISAWTVDPRFVDTVEQAVSGLDIRCIIISHEEEKHAAIAAANAALVKSGTVTLEVALIGTPMSVAYRVHPLSALVARPLIRTAYYTLLNIALGRPFIPEYIQEDCEPVKLSNALHILLSDDAAARQQIEDGKKALGILGLEADTSPSKRAAGAVLGLI